MLRRSGQQEVCYWNCAYRPCLRVGFCMWFGVAHVALTDVRLLHVRLVNLVNSAFLGIARQSRQSGQLVFANSAMWANLIAHGLVRSWMRCARIGSSIRCTRTTSPRVRTASGSDRVLCLNPNATLHDLWKTKHPAIWDRAYFFCFCLCFVYFVSLFRVFSGHLLKLNETKTQTFNETTAPTTFWDKTNNSFIHNNWINR
jgi:hypothetical protein